MGFGDTHRACAIPLSPRCAFCALRVGGSIIVIIACDNIERLSKRGLEGGESAARGYIGVVVGVVDGVSVALSVSFQRLFGVRRIGGRRLVAGWLQDGC